MSVQLPTKDKYTTYNYEVGKERMSLAQNETNHFIPVTTYYCGRHISTRPLYSISRKLWVFIDKKPLVEINLLPEEKTIEFSQKSIAKWGKEYAEKVLSATETGALYWNIIYHFHSYEKLLEKHHKDSSS